MTTHLGYRQLTVLMCLLLSKAENFSQAQTGPTTLASASNLPDGAVRQFGDLRLADTEMMEGAAFSFDGKSFVTAHRQVDFWDLPSGLHQHHLAKDGFDIYMCRYQRDGKILAIGQTLQREAKIDLINPLTDEIEQEYPAPAGLGAYTPDIRLDSNRIVWGSNAGISLAELTTGKKIKSLGLPPRTENLPITSPAQFSADGKRLLFLDDQGNTSIFDSLTGEQLSSAKISAPMGAVMMSASSRIAVAGDHIKLYDWKTGAMLQTLPDDPGPTNMVVHGLPWINCIAASPANGLLAALTTDRPARVLVWDTSQAKISRPWVVSSLQASPRYLTWSDDGYYLAVTCGEGRAQILNLSTRQFMFQSPMPRSIEALCVSSDGDNIFEADNLGKVARWSLNTGKLTASASLSEPTFGKDIHLLAENPADRSIVAATENGNVESLDPQTMKSRRLIGGDPRVVAVVVSNDGEVIAQQRLDRVSVWNLADARDICRISKPDQVQWSNYAISNDHSALVVNTIQGQQAYDLSTAKPTVFSPWPTDSYNISHLQFSPLGHWLLSGGDIGLAGYSSEHLLGNSIRDNNWWVDIKGVSDVCFSPAGGLVGTIGFLFKSQDTGYGNTQALILEPGHLQYLCTLSLTHGAMDKIRFVPHKPLIVSTSRFGGTTVWDLHRLVNLVAAEDQSNHQLFEDMLADSPSKAYRAGLELLDRNQLLTFAGQCTPLEDSLRPRKNPQQIESLIQRLSADKSDDREKAHKELEGCGSAAIDAIQRAIAKHPGGELEDRLNSIAGVIGANDINQSAKQYLQEDVFLQNSKKARTRRMIQLLDWSPDPAAAAQMKRLMGISQPTSLPAH